MLIDIIFVVLLIAAIFKGYAKGLIIAVFSVLAVVVGLAAAVKLSVVAASRLKDAVHMAAKWLPLIAFTLVFLMVVLLVRLGARALEKTAEFAFLGWANKLCGILLYIALYTVVFSVLLFYAEKVNIITPGTIASSKTYGFIKPWGPKAVNVIGTMVPFFKDMFHQLEDFFAGISDKIQPHNL
ncbi:MAG: CvpA family protein [Chitinophagaceae bacterium]